VVVIQEWWGLVPHIKEVAERFAAAGYVALAPDLYHGQATSEPDEARKLAMALDIPRALDEIRAAARYLQGLTGVTGKTGVIGWCMGGAVSWGIAANPGSVNIGATVVFYGRPPAVEEAGRIRVPVLGIFGELDGGIPVEAVRTFDQALDAHQKTHEIYIYEGAEHAFFNNTRAAFHPEAAQDAWEKTLAWFDRFLITTSESP